MEYSVECYSEKRFRIVGKGDRDYFSLVADCLWHLTLLAKSYKIQYQIKHETKRMMGNIGELLNGSMSLNQLEKRLNNITFNPSS